MRLMALIKSVPDSADITGRHPHPSCRAASLLQTAVLSSPISKRKSAKY
jgi:hypothetical protein